MQATGYSGTPLLKKLGIREDMKLWLMNAPNDYSNLLEKDISNQLISKNEMPDFIHFFAKSKKEFEQGMNKVLNLCKKKKDMVIWVSWYKKSAGIQSDLTETIIRNFALQNDLVDIKVCAVSEEWSGLKLVVPLKKR